MKEITVSQAFLDYLNSVTDDELRKDLSLCFDTGIDGIRKFLNTDTPKFEYVDYTFPFKRGIDHYEKEYMEALKNFSDNGYTCYGTNYNETWKELTLQFKRPIKIIKQ